MNRKSRLFTFAGSLLAVSVITALALAGPPKGGSEGGGSKTERPDPQALVGQPAPDFNLPILGNTKSVKLADLKGQVVFLDYWATWCPPCRKSLPHVQEMANDTELTQKGLRVYAVNCKETVDKARTFVKENNYSFTVLMDEKGKWGNSYNVRGIPQSVVIGRDGTVKKVFVGFGEGMEKEMRAAIEEALKEEAPTKTS